MYYEEEVINGILCFRTMPNGKKRFVAHIREVIRAVSRYGRYNTGKVSGAQPKSYRRTVRTTQAPRTQRSRRHR